MRNYRHRVIRHWWIWAASTVLMLAFLLALGYAFLNLVDDVVRQREYLLLVGGALIAASYILGQAVRSILINSLDTWIGDLGPTQLDMLAEEMDIEAAKMREAVSARKKAGDHDKE